MHFLAICSCQDVLFSLPKQQDRVSVFTGALFTDSTLAVSSAKQHYKHLLDTDKAITGYLIMEWFGLEETLKVVQFQRACQRHLPLDP